MHISRPITAHTVYPSTYNPRLELPTHPGKHDPALHLAPQ
jgi:hypothetical protein